MVWSVRPLKPVSHSVCQAAKLGYLLEWLFVCLQGLELFGGVGEARIALGSRAVQRSDLLPVSIPSHRSVPLIVGASLGIFSRPDQCGTVRLGVARHTSLALLVSWARGFCFTVRRISRDPCPARGPSCKLTA